MALTADSESGTVPLKNVMIAIKLASITVTERMLEKYGIQIDALFITIA